MKVIFTNFDLTRENQEDRSCNIDSGPNRITLCSFLAVAQEVVLIRKMKLVKTEIMDPLADDSVSVCIIPEIIYTVCID